MVFDDLKICAVANVPQKISNIVELLKIQALDENFAPETDRIHLQNGTLYIDGTFDESKTEIVRSRLPISYHPNAPVPKLWLSFLGELLHPEDIPTLQEFIGYCLIPSNKGQRMMVIKGNGGEGKSQIGAVMTTFFGSNMKDGSIGKISENRFARADLEHILLCIDDDLRMEGLKHTNYVKSIVTAQGKMDLEKKNKQSYQGYMYARLLAFSNGDLQAMFDKSDGFFRRQLVLTTKDKNAERIDDPHIADKMREEIEGIFLWAFEGLQRLLSNNFQFTESERAISNRETVKRNNVNAVEFMESDGYFVFAEDMFNVKGTDTITWNYYYDLDIDFSRLGIDSAGKEAITTRTLRITNSGYEFLTGNVLVNDLRIITSKDDTTGNCSNSYSIVSEITSVKNRCSTLESNLNTLTTNYNELVGGYNDLVSRHNQLAKDFATLRNKVNSYHPS